MRRLLPTARSFLIHSGQAAALAGVAVLAMAAAPLADPADPAVPDVLAVPAAPPMTAVAEPAGPVTRLIAFEAPVRGHEVNSPFGLRRLPGQAARNHAGVDIAAPSGTGVYVSAEGSVLRTGYEPAGYGRFVEIRHPNGMTTLYGHLSRLDVASGDRLEAGERIGLVGSTGRSTGPHLHFEVRRGDRQINPVKVMGRAFEVVVADTTA
ncbi:MAG: M23 family metallopeptidase [Alphaproteobacteria bacterium]|jgi:murein DD-endopeptidase MepM/ murein hydrolase activator NlpD|nr:M23 family metallopeptidase [Alphaproteobacteria bacterium]MBU2041965.1 M23 family metallopeptidase [Alphaproteobacteria bacterium]MBU2125119.1 M23 family metallopeptidase [Alphaproteobacteria bacterium]MBU2207530.1 M23 family metallopeptidase [Alphaproteobacteria bacterium]MBU2291275.1 M23 family metallopeptidase [Alphaproteobacteria bacterium]